MSGGAPVFLAGIHNADESARADATCSQGLNRCGLSRSEARLGNQPCWGLSPRPLPGRRGILHIPRHHIHRALRQEVAWGQTGHDC